MRKKVAGNGDQLHSEVVATFASRLGVPLTKPFSFRGLCPLTPAVGFTPDPHYRLALRACHYCPPHIFTRGDTPAAMAALQLVAPIIGTRLK